jgi:transcriptional regulator with XRE-family HTH domain
MENLRELRVMADFTQMRLAYLSKVWQSRISAAENCDIELTKEEQARIKKILVPAIRTRSNQITKTLATVEA